MASRDIHRQHALTSEKCLSSKDKFDISAHGCQGRDPQGRREAEAAAATESTAQQPDHSRRVVTITELVK